MTIFRKWVLIIGILLFVFPAVSSAQNISIVTLPSSTSTPPEENLAEEIILPDAVQTPSPTPAPSPVVTPSSAPKQDSSDSAAFIPSIPTPEKQQLYPVNGIVATSHPTDSSSTGSSIVSVDASAQDDYGDGLNVPAYMPYVTLAPLPETETHYSLPIDFTGGKTPLSEGYITDYEYEDPTIHVKIERGREADCTFWICEVRIADASQLRTASADGFDSNMTMPGSAIAKRVNAVVAIDGDYFCYTGRGFILRQGREFLNRTTGGRDVLLIDEDGDFHIIRKAKRNECSDTINGKKVINAFFFGPVLVEDGVLGTEFRYTDMAYDLYSQRMAIAQVGKLHYKIICCESPKRGSSGMTLKQFAEFCQGKGIKTAYNLDGGDSTMLIFRNRKLNDIDNPHTREIADIIYFASAYTPE